MQMPLPLETRSFFPLLRMIEDDSGLRHVFDDDETEGKGLHDEIELILRQQNKKMHERSKNSQIQRRLLPLLSLNPGLIEVLLIPFAV
jgi:hypothetical protein